MTTSNLKFGKNPCEVVSMQETVQFLLDTMVEIKGEMCKAWAEHGCDSKEVAWLQGERAGIRRTLYTLGFVKEPDLVVSKGIDEESGDTVVRVDLAPYEIMVKEEDFV